MKTINLLLGWRTSHLWRNC